MKTFASLYRKGISTTVGVSDLYEDQYNVKVVPTIRSLVYCSRIDFLKSLNISELFYSLTWSDSVLFSKAS